jgi:hypothetical protein
MAPYQRRSYQHQSFSPRWRKRILVSDQSDQALRGGSACLKRLVAARRPPRGAILPAALEGPGFAPALESVQRRAFAARNARALAFDGCVPEGRKRRRRRRRSLKRAGRQEKQRRGGEAEETLLAQPAGEPSPIPAAHGIG